LQRISLQQSIKKAPDKEATALQKAPSTAIDSEALHEKLAHLLKEDELRAARGEKRDPVSGQEKRAVYKAKGEAKRGNDLARVFQQTERQNTELLRASMEGKRVQEGLASSRRGFAEKMFADAAVGSPVGEEHRNEDKEVHVSFGKTVESLQTTPRINRHDPLLVQPATSPPMSAVHESGNAEANRPSTPDAFMTVSPALDRHFRSFCWGSLGPPTHLADAQKIDTDPFQSPNQRAKKELDAWKLVEVMPQFGRSADLNVTLAASYEDNAAVVAEEGKMNPRYSFTSSQVEAISRIQDWRINTGTPNSSDLYAPSANATEPSAFFRGENGDANSHLTSISRCGQMKVDRESKQRGEMEVKVDKGKEPECQSDLSTIVGANANGDHRQKDIDQILADSNSTPTRPTIKLPATSMKTEKLIDVASPPLSPPLGNGTKHIRQLSPDESRKLFELME
jgi:hypothetical protein